jgi:diguanylate cyclase (GGDEF)-like protein/PAS domain S-box-containing protein
MRKFPKRIPPSASARKQVEAALARQAQELALLDQVRSALARELDLGTVIRTVVEAIHRTFGYTQVSLYFLKGDELALQHQVGYSQVIERIPLSLGVSGRVVRSGRPELLADVRQDPTFLGAIEGVVSEICIPLFEGDRVFGILNVESTGGVKLNEADLRLMSALGQHVNIAIGRARLYTLMEESREQYRTVVENVGEGIGIVDWEERIIFANPAAHEIFGLPVGELIGRSARDFVSAETFDLIKSETRLRQAGEPSVYEFEILRPDGAQRCILLTATPRYDSAGHYSGTFGIFHDITERKQAEALLSERAVALAHQAEQLDALYATGLEINTQIDLQPLLYAIIQRAAGLVGTDMGGLYLIHPDVECRSDCLELVVGYNVPAGHIGTVLGPGEGLAGWVAQTGQPQMVTDYAQWAGRPAVYQTAPFRRALGVPLKRGDRVSGVITVTDSRQTGLFAPEDVRLVSLFADQAAIAIENARLYVQLQSELAERERIAAALRSLNLELEDRVQTRTAELAGVIGKLEAEIAERRRAENDLRHRVEIETLLAAISARFIRAGPGEVDAEIDEALAGMGRLTGVDRAYVFQFSPDGEIMTNTHEWCAEGIEPQIGNLQQVQVSQFPWWMERLRRFESIHLPKLSDLLPEASAEWTILQAQDIRSIVVVPLGSRQEVIGFLGFDAVRAEKTWSEEDIALLRITGEILVGALERRRVEAALRDSEAELRALFLAMSDVVIVYDRQGRYRKIAPTSPALLYRASTELLGKTVNEVLPPDQASLLVNSIGLALDTCRPVEVDYRLEINGREVWFAGTLSPMTGDLAILVARDITERKRIEEQLQYDAFHDALTGLPNRALFLDRLGRAIERAHRHPEDRFAVLFLDLDRFKVINDSLGHTFGDHLLVAFARRLEGLLRSADTAARLGGDEFVILLEELSDPDDAASVANRLREELRIPFALGIHRLVISASIGIVQNGAIYTRPMEILRDADIAMYRAKALGKDRYEIFDSALRESAINRLEMEGELRSALEQHEFRLHYQPIRALETGRLIGFEALLRWSSPTRGLVAPADFIPLAEETGLIIPIGAWVLRQACRQARQWQQLFPSDPPLAINVNLSGRQFAHPHLLEEIQAALSETGLDPASLRLEITESAFMQDLTYASQVLLELRKLGVKLQIDDFGTGYSSLAYLQKLPIHTIKIDRSFVAQLGVNPADTIESSDGSFLVSENGVEIVKTIVSLARGLGMEATAEGIETEEQLARLIDLQCPNGQGFLLATPLEPAAVEAMLEGKLDLTGFLNL